MDTQKVLELFTAQKVVVINVGIRAFGDAVEKQGVEVLQVDWRPPAGGDREMQDILAKLGAF